jgi:hypothetical protein
MGYDSKKSVSIISGETETWLLKTTFSGFIFSVRCCLQEYIPISIMPKQ